MLATRRATDMPPLAAPGCDVKPAPSPEAGRAGAESTEFCYVPSRPPLALADVAGYPQADRGSTRGAAASEHKQPGSSLTPPK
jgi:hypothetical protein